MFCGACCAGDSELVVQGDNASKMPMAPMVAAMSAGAGGTNVLKHTTFEHLSYGF